MNGLFARTERLVGAEGLSRLQAARVILFGTGGVGSWCAEALIRSGIGHLTMVVPDDVDVTNINRHWKPDLRLGLCHHDRDLSISPVDVTELQVQHIRCAKTHARAKKYYCVISEVYCLAVIFPEFFYPTQLFISKSIHDRFFRC